MASAFEMMAAAHRRRLERLMGAGSHRLKKLYDEAQAEQLKKVTRLAGRLGETFTVYQNRIIQAQLRQGQLLLANDMAGELGDHTEEVGLESIRSLAADIGHLARRYQGADVVLPVDEASTFLGIVKKRKPSMLSMHKTSMHRYGAENVLRMQDELAKGLIQEETTGEVIGRLEKFTDGAWGRAERIARTETAYAYNAVHRDGLAEASKELTGLASQWWEHATATSAPLDSRVAVDSLAMHRQVAAVGQLFTMPAMSPHADARGETVVPESLVGLSWAHPPNRPNDRSVLIPFHKSWGAPGWRWAGRRVPV